MKPHIPPRRRNVRRRAPALPVALVALGVGLLGHSPLLASTPAGRPGEADSRSLVDAAIAAQPGLNALHTRARALRAEAAATRSDRPDPMVMGTVYVDTFNTMEPGRIRTMFEVSQTLPGRTRRDAAALPMEARAEGATAEEALAIIALRRQVQEALLARERAAELTEAWSAQDALLADLEDLLAATMPVGRGSYADLLALGVAREQIATRLDRLRGEAQAAAGQLHALIPGEDVRGRGADDRLPDVDPLLTLRGLPETDALLAASMEHPVFALAQVDREVASAEHDALRIARRPVPTVSVGVGTMPMVNDGTGMMVMGGLAMRIPVFGEATAHRQEASSLRAEAAGERADGAHVDLASGIRAEVERHGEALRRLERLESRLVPLAEDVIERMVTDIETGRATYADVLRAVVQREAIVVETVEARFDALRAQVALEALVGAPLQEVER